MPPDDKYISRAGNTLVHPSHNSGKDYIIIRKIHNFRATAAEIEEAGLKQVYLAIPELPISHAHGDNIPYPIEANGHICYKVPKAVLHKLAYKTSSDDILGHYYIFLTLELERSHIKSKINNMREGVLTRDGDGGKV